HVGEAFLELKLQEGPDSGALKLAESIIPSVLQTWTEVQNNPLAAAQNALITGAYVTYPFLSSLSDKSQSASLDSILKKFAIAKQADSQSSFLLNPRVYSKLSNHDDQAWFCRALSAVARHLPPEPRSPSRIAWSQAFVSLICLSGAEQKVKRQAL